jgi:predicted dinucleotide-binding enzyme
MNIGIFGAGNIGAAVAKLAADVGHDVMISSRHPQHLVARAATIGCRAGTIEQAASHGELCLAAIPLNALESLPAALLAGKIVIDAMNYYPDRDGRIVALDQRLITTSELVARHLQHATIVKAINAILAQDLPIDSRPSIPTGRRALPIAGDDPHANQVVASLLAEFGFDTLDTGPLAESWRFERAKPAYCIPLDKPGLIQALKAATRETELPDGSWRR